MLVSSNGSEKTNAPVRMIQGDTTKISINDKTNLTLKRKRLVRQEAVTHYDEKKDPPEASATEEKPSKILSLQSESTGSTETVIEAAPSPAPTPAPAPPSPAASSSRHKRPDNLDIGLGPGSGTGRRKHSSSSGHQQPRKHSEERLPGGGAKEARTQETAKVAGAGAGRRKTVSEVTGGGGHQQHSVRAVSLSSG